MQTRFLLRFVTLLLVLAVPLYSQDSDTSAAETYFTNTVLIDQNGESHRFFEDLLKGKTVVISSFHTSCNGVALVYNRHLGKIQEAFEDRMGSELFFISITLDPEKDTPARLKEYAKKFDAGPGWLFLTGSRQNVDFMLKKLGYFVADIEDHNSTFTIGNVRTSLWKKAFGLAKAEDLIKIVRSVLDDEGK